MTTQEEAMSDDTTEAQDERRAPLDEPQLIALAQAEATGALPAEDRRHEEPAAEIVTAPEPVVEAVAVVPEPVAPTAPAPAPEPEPQGFPAGHRITTAEALAGRVLP